MQMEMDVREIIRQAELHKMTFTEYLRSHYSPEQLDRMEHVANAQVVSHEHRLEQFNQRK
jgi:hypothetical protein